MTGLIGKLRRSFSRAPAINVKVIPDGWVLPAIAGHLENIQGLKISATADPESELNYFINYVQFEEVPTATAAWFTHIEESSTELTKLWWDVADRVDICIFHAHKYERIVKERLPHKETVTISPGVDFGQFHPRKLRIGVLGRAYSATGRKGEAILREIIKRNPDVEWVISGEGWGDGVESTYFASEALPEIYRSLDYVLITSKYEGGPMSALEALASGVPVIAPDVGWIPELPHVSFDAESVDSLQGVLTDLKHKRNALRDAVTSRTWENFAMGHERVFSKYFVRGLS